ncbi:MAG TPA: 2Fe-2S iron-sulfur cluster binding domain-containing protein [Phycisphaerales bacterium]|nr:2Fe-2S iron-sulfur cluster binding domain-containing protein [Phycisphaerales bacterium]
MISFLVTVFIVSLIAAVLALALVVAERYIADYGECQITLNDKRKIAVEGGKPLLSVLREEKIFIPSACGGRGTCGVCKVKVLDGAGPILPTETPFMTKDEIAGDVRLSCQVKVRGDLSIEIPDELFNVREYTTRCAGIEELTYDMKRFRFELTEPKSIDYVPGQYVQLLCPRYKGSSEEVYRAYSIASDPNEKGVVELIIRRVPNGICTTWCFEYLKEGDTVKLNGPYGEFRLSESDAPMVFVAGGSGMAPFVSILHQMKHNGIQREAVYFFGGNAVRDLCLIEQMKAFEKALPNFTFVPVVARPEEDDHWDGETGLVTDAVKRKYEDLSGYEGYLCGSPGMIDAAIKVFTSLGMPDDKIYYDKFA